LPFENGQTLGHYRILRPLGTGGMGEVYEAEDTKLGRRVALKVLPEETSRDPQRRERFEREAKAIAALNHPGIVTIYSVEQAGGVDFITMELLEGQTLRRTLPRTGLPFDRFLEYAVPLAEAMAAAHRQGITHRDLKPENIVIGRDGKLKVVDFGLAKRDEIFASADSGSRAPTRALTEEGRIVGTVAYMSPEQAEGKPVDPRSDVFTLGIICYEMCTGERPFRGETTVSVLSSILKDTPPAVTQINTTLPRDVSRIVNRCLMKDPSRRFQSAVGLATELTELKRESDSGELAVASGEIRRSGTGTPAAGKAGGVAGAPRVARYAAIAAVVLALATAGYLVLRGRPSGTAARLPAPPGPGTGATGAATLPGTGSPTAAGQIRQRIVVLPFENLGEPGDAYFADGVTEEISSRLASVSGLGVISRNSAAQYAKTTKSTREIGTELNVDYVLSGTVRWQRGAGGASRVRVTPQLVRVDDDTQLWGDRYDRQMQDIFTVQSEIAEQVVGKLGLAMRHPASPGAGSAAPTENLDAYQLYLRGRAEAESPEARREVMRKGIDLLEQAVRLDPRFAQGWAALGYAHSLFYNNRYDYSEERLAKARECADRALDLQPDLREGRLALGYYYYWGRRDYAQAAVEFAAAARGREDDPEALAAMAFMKRRQGKWDEALAAMERAYALNPLDFNLVSNLAGTYHAMWRHPEALRYMDRSIELAQGAPMVRMSKVFMQLETDGNTRQARETLKGLDVSAIPDFPPVQGFLDLIDGRYEEALRHIGTFPRDVIEGQTFYRPKVLLEATIYLAMNDRARAAIACDAARRRLEQDVARNPRDPRMRSALGYALACLGRRADTVREAKLAIDIMPVSTDALDGPAYLEGLAAVYATLGDADAAIDVLKKFKSLPGSGTAAQLLSDPVYAPIRDHPRFKEVLAIAH
jgi:TolB-like protein/tetratricopeptide (TPR) repeat protein